MLYRDFSTQEELDAQYNPRASVSDVERYMELYVAWSRRARRQLDCQLDVPFGPTLAEYFDIFPAKQPNAPILVFIHGGYWSTLSSKEFSFVAQGPVSAGFTTAVTNYALCPKVTIDEIVRQSRAAIAWLYRNAKGFSGDNSRIYVSGHSAGGHLTAMLMTTDWEGDYGLPTDVIKGGCSISGLFDLAPFPYTYLQPKLQLTWGEVLRNSPILHIPSKAPPFLISYGEEETTELRRQSQDFLDAWNSQGLEASCLSLAGKNHYSVIEGFIDATSPLCEAILKQLGNRS